MGADRQCCVENCNSRSTREEDLGVTYHKFPKDVTLRHRWISITRTTSSVTGYVCSRHFCKSDFKTYKDSKYILKPDAIPSIFSWVASQESTMESLKPNTSEKDTTVERKLSEGESLDDIKKFIEDQEKEFQEQKVQEKKEDEGKLVDSLEDTLAVASSVMDMILSESEAKIASSTDCEVKLLPPTLCTDDKGSMALSVGSKVEAKDFEDNWYPASITEVDYDEMEVLVHFENELKHDEWINVSSPRLRPVGSGPMKCSEEIPEPEPEVKVEAKEDKPKLTFEAGERCLARWRDNRRFMATVNRLLENGNYEIIFDDGFLWTCSITRLSKLKAGKQEALTIDTSCKSPNAALSPVYGPGPSNLAPTPMPAYHTHLFDPTRDYLSSKIERREMKRKLNIKEIFNIGQKRPKGQKSPKESKRVVKKPIVKKTIKPKRVKMEIKSEAKMELPDALASIIGTFDKPKTPTADDSSGKYDENVKEEKEEDNHTEKEKPEANNDDESPPEADLSDENELKPDHDPVLDEEVKLEKFDKQDDGNHEEVLDRMKEVINKLEDGLKEDELSSPKPELKIEEKEEVPVEELDTSSAVVEDKEKIVAKPKKVKIKMKRSKKLRILQENKVKQQVAKVKNELEEMKKQVEEMKIKMKQQMLMKTQDLSGIRSRDVSEDYLAPEMWCCKWLNGQPVGMVSEIECEVKVDANNKPALPRRSVQVEDRRLPEGWTKHMVRRSLGHSAGKWDVVLVSPENRRFHTKNEMRNYFENNPNAARRLEPYEHVLLDFGVHLKLSRRMGWISHTPGGLPDDPVSRLPAGTLSSTSPLVKRKKLSLKKKEIKVKHKKRRLAMKYKLSSGHMKAAKMVEAIDTASSELSGTVDSVPDQPPLEDGYVYVGSLKVQIIENLLRCPADGCLKNFRNNTLLKMHIKHYHRELRKMMGATPKVSDLAYARTMPEGEDKKLQPDPKIIKVKLPKMKRDELKADLKDLVPEKVEPVEPTTPVKAELDIPQPTRPKALDSPKLRLALVAKPQKGPRVLLPVRRPDPEPVDIEHPIPDFIDMEPMVEIPELPALDFETAISTHTVTKPLLDKNKKGETRKSFAPAAKRGFSEDDDWFGTNSDVDTRSSFPRSGSPDSKTMLDDINTQPLTSEAIEEQKDDNMYTFTESGERIKIVHMKREEIINCHCGFREEDGLMVQCELCLCWQHALCHNIQKESEVPDKYTCSICLNPRRGRRSQRFLHDQDRLYEGLLPGGAPSEALRRHHELSGNLLQLQDSLHALRLKYYVATKKNHPKLYLWAKDWENGELQYTQERLNSEYSDLNIMINTMGNKENLPMKGLGMTPPLQDDDPDRYSQREATLGSQTLLSGFLSSPGGASLDLPISTSELERLARSVQQQEQEPPRVIAPQPEAAIENGACRQRLLRHISRCHVIIDARLDSIEAQIAELESQDPSFQDDETADYIPRTKRTVQMLMRDLDTLEELGVIT